MLVSSASGHAGVQAEPCAHPPPSHARQIPSNLKAHGVPKGNTMGLWKLLRWLRVCLCLVH